MQPFAVFVFENPGPAEIPHLDFAGLGRHLFLDRGGDPDEVAVGMNRRRRR